MAITPTRKTALSVTATPGMPHSFSPKTQAILVIIGPSGSVYGPNDTGKVIGPSNTGKVRG